MNISLRQLEAFCKIVETGSFSKAADEICLTQSSISERIASLEEEVGARLFDRFGRKVFLTDAGRFFYVRAKRLLEEKERICLEIQDFLGLKKGELKIGGSTIPGEYLLPTVIKRFHDTYPLIDIRVTVNDSKKIQEMVLDGYLHLGIVGFIGEHKNPNIEAIKIWKDELVVVVPKGHKWSDKKEIEAQDIIKEPFIIRERGSGTLRVMEQYLKKYIGSSEELNIIATLGSSTAVKEGVKSGLGISIISIKAIESELNAGLVSALRIKGVKMIRYFYLIWDKRRTKSPASQAFIEFMEGEKEL
ncbi:MAG: LysR family transcriptional regulator [Deltaproteobacteria bacterium]|nr:MAG: LysR family transcriptional regulator [Deltaproteobacteria bacterium]